MNTTELEKEIEHLFGGAENKLGMQFDKTGTYSPYIILNELKKELIENLLADKKAMEKEMEERHHRFEELRKGANSLSDELQKQFKTIYSQKKRISELENSKLPKCDACGGETVIFCKDNIESLERRSNDLFHELYDKDKKIVELEASLKNCITFEEAKGIIEQAEKDAKWARHNGQSRKAQDLISGIDLLNAIFKKKEAVKG